MQDRPSELTPDVAGFWGGYVVEFKLVDVATFREFSTDVSELRKRAIRIGQGAKFLIDISKFEYTTGKQTKNLDGYQIFVYSPEMMVAEKLRAICQQMEEYGPVVKRTRRGAGRARDFVDIHTLVTKRQVDVATEEFRSLLAHVFAAKKVPLEFLALVQNYREFHRGDFQAVKDSVKPGVKLMEFDAYFDFVLDIVDRLKPFWNV